MPSTKPIPKRTHATTDVAWQGWRVKLPARWSPVKLEGDFDRGYALFADLHRPRLGLRWQKIRRGKKFNAGDVVRRAMLDEVGKLAAAEAKAHAPPEGGEWTDSILFMESDPPGRDVWASFSEHSGRILIVSHHAHRRERILPDAILPTVTDVAKNELGEQPWSVFDLSCRVNGLPLRSQRLNVGDLSLTFAANKGPDEVTVRQIAVAELALQRQPLEKWLVAQERPRQKYYRPAGKPVEFTVDGAGGRELVGLRRDLRRRRRYFWMWWRPPRFTTLALHDEERDRLVLLQSNSADTAKDVGVTVGWAAGPRVKVEGIGVGSGSGGERDADDETDDE